MACRMQSVKPVLTRKCRKPHKNAHGGMGALARAPKPDTTLRAFGLKVRTSLA